MWRRLVLCLAAALASGFDEKRPPRPVIPKIYTMRAEYIDYVHHTPIKSLKIWYDSHQPIARYDADDDDKIVRAARTKENRHGEIVEVFPATSETNEVTPSCVHIAGNKYRSIKVGGFLPDMRYPYSYEGKGEIRGREAYLWQEPVAVNYRFFINLNFWVAYEQDEANNTITIPLRFTVKGQDSKTGKILWDAQTDYYDYEILDKIDPEIWNIHKGITCKEFNPGPKPKKQLPHQYWDLNDLLRLTNKGGTFGVHLQHMKAESDENGDSPGEFSEQETPATVADKPASEPDNALPFPYSESEIEEMSRGLPEELDWRALGAVSAVKDQLDDKCLNTWIFSAAGAVEGHHFLKTGRKELVWLSEQALIDCTWGFGNNGCYGGSVEKAFDWIKKYGLMSYSNYRKVNTLHNYCNLTDVEMVANITGYARIPPNEKALKVALNKFGPVAAGFNSDQDYSIEFYNGGIYNYPHCLNDEKHLDTNVLVVGYGVLDGQRYWIVKFPWSEQFGDNGYMLLSAEGNQCGILTKAYSVM